MTDEPKVADPITEAFAHVGNVRIKDGDITHLEFKVSIALRDGPDGNERDILHAARAQRAGGGYVTLRLAQLPMPDPPDPVDGAVPGDPFPEWNKLFDEAEMPVCVCEALDAPVIMSDFDDDGNHMVTVSHEVLCPLGVGKRISTADFTTTEDFNRAVVKARGRRATTAPPDDLAE